MTTNNPPAARPSRPWKPTDLSVSTPVRRPLGKEERWDVRIEADGHKFKRTFRQKGYGVAFAKVAYGDLAKGWHFDPVARAFVDPTKFVSISFYDMAVHYFAHHAVTDSRWQPGTRNQEAHHLIRAVVWFVPSKKRLAPESEECQNVLRFLREEVMVVMSRTPAQYSKDDQAAADYLAGNSLDVNSLTTDLTDEYMEFLNVAKGRRKGQTKPRSVGSKAECRKKLSAALAWSVAKGFSAANPMDTKTRRAPGGGMQPLDLDLLISPLKVMAIIHKAVELSGNPRLEGHYVLQHEGGARPSEAIEVRARDIIFPSRGRVKAYVVFRGSHRSAPQRQLLETETRRGPLKRRAPNASRKVPMPDHAIPALRRLTEGVAPGDYVLSWRTGAAVNIAYTRRWWDKAVAEVLAPADREELLVTLGSLRHCAITHWLRSGLNIKTVQRFAGHSTAFVTLTRYAGAFQDLDDEMAHGAMNAYSLRIYGLEIVGEAYGPAPQDFTASERSRWAELQALGLSALEAEGAVRAARSQAAA